MKGFKYVILLLCLLIAACISVPVKPKVFVITPNQTPEQARHEQAQKIIAGLRLNPNVRYMQQGEMVTIVLCGDSVFYPGSATLIPSATLDSVAQLLQVMTGLSTQVTAYTNWMCTANQNAQLASRQAKIIARYLWNRDIDTRLLSTRGVGSAYPAVRVFSPQNPGGIVPSDCVSRRVEICFQDP